MDRGIDCGGDPLRRGRKNDAQVHNQATDNTLCLYLADYSVVVAEFKPGCDRDARIVETRLEAADALAVAAKELIDSITNDQLARTTLLEYRATCGDRILSVRDALRQYREVTR